MSVNILAICMMPDCLNAPETLVVRKYPHSFSEAKKMADQAMKDPMSLVNNVGALKFW